MRIIYINAAQLLSAKRLLVQLEEQCHALISPKRVEGSRTSRLNLDTARHRRRGLHNEHATIQPHLDGAAGGRPSGRSCPNDRLVSVEGVCEVHHCPISEKSFGLVALVEIRRAGHSAVHQIAVCGCNSGMYPLTVGESASAHSILGNRVTKDACIHSHGGQHD